MKSKTYYNGIPVIVQTPSMYRLEVAVMMRKERKPINEITKVINEMIEEQNEVERELGLDETPKITDNETRAALAWWDSKVRR